MNELGELTVLETKDIVRGLNQIITVSDSLAMSGVQGAHEIYRLARDIRETVAFDAVSREALRKLIDPREYFREILVTDVVDEMVKNGQYIQAIKQIRETHGLGLKEAKDWVDAYKEHLAYQARNAV